MMLNTADFRFLPEDQRMSVSVSQISQANASDSVLVDLFEEIAAKLQAGEQVDLEAYAREHPEQAEPLRRLLPTIHVLADLGRSAAKGDPSVASVAAPVELERGVLGDFRIFQEIGRGGMGIVYEAEQISLGRRVALKVLPFAAAMDPKQLQRFKNEAQAAAHLQHTNIVPVYYVGCERGVHFYAMQYIEGQTVAAVIHHLRLGERGGVGRRAGGVSPLMTLKSPDRRLHQGANAPRSPEVATTPPVAVLSTEHSTTSQAFFRTVARFGVQAAEALEHAHQLGVIHRDIKPANLLVEAGGRLWVTDFGLAHCQSQPALTMTGDVVGTLRYMSPEQALAKRVAVDARTDIYSLGVTLYELLTLQPPYNGRDREELLRQIAFEEPRLPSRWNPALPAELETIVLKAMAKSAEERYATAQELADDLKRYLKDEPIRARRPTLVQRAKKWMRRHQPVVWTAGLALVAMLLLAVVGLAASNILITREKAQTDAAKHDLEGHLYAKNIALAEREWDANNFGRAEDLLEKCPQHLRGWEWDYVMGLRRGNPPPFRGHTGDVGSVAFHPNGRLLVSAGNEGKIKVWEMNTSKEIFTREGSSSPYFSVAAFSPDGRYFAGLVGWKDLKVWDAATGEEVCVFRGHTKQLVHFAFSPDSQHIASCSYDQTIRIWDVANRRPPRILQGNTSSLQSVAFSRDGKVLCSTDGGSVRLWDMATGEVCGTLEGHTEQVKLAVFSRDGTRIASSSGAPLVYRGVGGEVIVWDAATGQRLHTLLGHKGLVSALVFSADGRRLATAGYDQTVKIWDLATAQEVLTLRGHSDWVYSLAFSADGRWLASASADKTVRLWDATPLKDKPTPELRTLRHHRGYVTSVAYSPDGRSLASTGLDQTVQICDPISGRVVRKLERHTGGVNHVVFSTDGKLLASASLDQTVKVWDAQTGGNLHSFREHNSVVQDVVFGPDQRLASVCWGLSLRIWDARTGKVFLPLEKVHEDMVHSLALSPDGRLLATAAHDMTVRIRDAETGKLIHTLKHDGRLTSVAFSPDGRLLASAGMEGIVRIFETSSWAEVRIFPGHKRWIWCVRFSPDGRRLASVGNDAIVHLWDVNSGQEVRALHGHTDCIECVAFRPDGKQIATASWDGTIKIWDAATEEVGPQR
jgi:WD40 repeat protein/serine/threonine protein kinase